MSSRKGSVLIESLAACFIAVIVSFCVVSFLRISVMIVSTPYELLEIERAKQAALSEFSSGTVPDQINYNNVRIKLNQPTSKDKNIILTIEKDGFMKVRKSYVVWPNENT